ncbi:MAG: complex I subunit 4 family protein, partial [Candidatus Kapaibacteriota bacterium]
MGVAALLTTLFAPLAGMAVISLIQRDQTKAIKLVALCITVFTFVASLFLLPGFDQSTAAMQFGVDVSWIPAIDAGLRLGIDGTSLLLVLLTTLIMPIALLASYHSIKKMEKEYYALMLLLQFGMTGVFLALDTFLFYVFWELILIPMYFIIGIWGGKDRIYASIKFFLYTLVGSLLMLIAILWLSFEAAPLLGGFTTDLLKLQSVGAQLDHNVQFWLFMAFGLSFMIKV